MHFAAVSLFAVCGVLHGVARSYCLSFFLFLSIFLTSPSALDGSVTYTWKEQLIKRAIVQQVPLLFADIFIQKMFALTSPSLLRCPLSFSLFPRSPQGLRPSLPSPSSPISQIYPQKDFDELILQCWSHNPALYVQRLCVHTLCVCVLCVCVHTLYVCT